MNITYLRMCSQDSRAVADFGISIYIGVYNITVIKILKGKYHANLLSFQNPKMFVCQQKQRNNCQVCYKLSPQYNIKLSFSASSQRQSSSEWIET